MSAPDRETVRAAMNDLAIPSHIVRSQRNILRANARDLANTLREQAHSLCAQDLEALADQLDPQP